MLLIIRFIVFIPVISSFNQGFNRTIYHFKLVLFSEYKLSKLFNPNDKDAVI